ncbi:ABC transporter ATP-binding protein [Neobacillus sp. 19]|uniref:ABC transporter ATP-binding protein n=1 Tax=Neobacillus sp. 19 TaxID=3394458 RepID=UPI003BF6D3E8
MSNSVLEVKDLDLSFKTTKGELQALSEVSFTISEGEIVGLVGESGCGKSITSLSIMGLNSEETSLIKNGTITFNDQDMTKWSQDQFQKIRGKDISMIFQEPMTSLNPVLSIKDQLTEGIRLHLKLSRKEAQKHVLNILEKVGIPKSRNILDEYPHQLSGGMRQRVMIAMALACNPKLLIADEPTTALDVTIQAQILELLKEINREYKTSMLFITHDLGVVSEICDRVIVMYAGQVIETGTVDDILHNPRHPYTKGLLNSVPKIMETRKRLDTIQGTVPQLSQMPKGCRFAPRCKHATQTCMNKPKMVNVDNEHYARCFYAV